MVTFPRQIHRIGVGARHRGAQGGTEGHRARGAFHSSPLYNIFPNLGRSTGRRIGARWKTTMGPSLVNLQRRRIQLHCLPTLKD